MRLIRYTPAMFPSLQPIATPDSGLVDRGFVDYYYATREHCQLHLALDPQGVVIGSIGIELMPLEHEGQRQTIAFGSNFLAAHSGVGGFLFLTWMKSAPLALVFGGSPDTHRILRAQKWTYYSGVRVYQAHGRYAPRAGDGFARRFAKRLLRAAAGGPDLRQRVAALKLPVEVRELSEYPESLAATPSPFALRLAPDRDYLQWRYALDLPFARYRLYEVSTAQGLIGHVVLHERASKVVVAHADGADARLLAAGMMKAAAQVIDGDRHPRAIMLTSAHPQMQAVFAAHGLRPEAESRQFAMKGQRGTPLFAPDTANWLVNFDWGDNSLRPPFGRP